MERIYVSWESPAWLFKERNKEFFKNVAAIVFFIVVILFFAREFLLVFSILSLVFLLYVFSSVRPSNISHKITNFGIKTDQQFYPWGSLSEFWFETQWDKETLIISLFTGQKIIMILEGVEKDDVKNIMMRFLPMREKPEKSFTDKTASWFSKKIPLENQTR